MITVILLCYIGHLLDAPAWYFIAVIIKALAMVLKLAIDLFKAGQKYEREV